MAEEELRSADARYSAPSQAAAVPKARAKQPSVAVDRLTSWERELLEIVLLEPEAVPAAAEVAPPDEMESPIAQRIFTRCCELSRDGITPDFDRLLLEFDEPAIKNLLVDLDEHGRDKTLDEKGNVKPAAEPAVRLRDLLDSLRASRKQAAPLTSTRRSSASASSRATKNWPCWNN